MKKILIFLVVFLVLMISGATVVVATIDANAYRPQITQMLHNKTGLNVTLAGSINLHMTWSGVALDIADVAMGNPAWASRPNMAHVGHFGLGVAVLPLLSKRLVITHLMLDDADILLESAKDNRHNWDMKVTTPASNGAMSATQASETSSGAVSIRVDSLAVTKSQISLRGEDGTITHFRTNELTLKQQTDGTVLGFNGAFNDQPITMTVKTNASELTSDDSRPVDVELSVANYHFKGAGKVTLGTKKAIFDSYEVTAGTSVVNGKLALEWGGAKPDFIASVNSNHVAVADFKMESKAGASTALSEAAMPPQARFFSDASLGLQALKSANAKMNVRIDALDVGTAEFHNLETNILLQNGNLMVAPFVADLGAGRVNAQIHINGATEPAQLGVTLDADGIDISKILHAASFISGKVNMAANLASTGGSLHEIASNLSGTVSFMGAGGDIITRTSDRIASGIESLLSGGSKGEENLNCMIARFTAKNGLVRDNGILLDTGAATVAGSGGLDLRAEAIDLMFHAKSKILDTGGFLPPMHVGGTFLKPDVNVSATSVVQNIAGLLLNGEAPKDYIPDVVVQQGQNACLAALNRPAPAASATPKTQVQGVVQKLGGQAGQMLKGLFGQ